MKIIQHQKLTAGQATITFNSIPQTFTDLVLVFSLRSNNGSYAFDDIGLRVNGDSTSNYLNNFLRTRDGSRLAFAGGGSSMTAYAAPSAGASAATFGSGFIYIPNYAGSSQKIASLEGASANNSSSANQSGIVAGRWNGTAAINSLTIASLNGWDFIPNSSVTLYGVTKGNGGVVVS